MVEPRDFSLEPVTALEQLASELNHSGKSQYVGVLLPTSCRLEPGLFGMVEAMAHHAGTSRNKVMNQLIEVGIQETLAVLSDDLVDELHRHSSVVVSDALDKGYGETVREGL